MPFYRPIARWLLQAWRLRRPHASAPAIAAPLGGAIPTTPITTVRWMCICAERWLVWEGGRLWLEVIGRGHRPPLHECGLLLRVHCCLRRGERRVLCVGRARTQATTHGTHPIPRVPCHPVPNPPHGCWWWSHCAHAYTTPHATNGPSSSHRRAAKHRTPCTASHSTHAVHAATNTTTYTTTQPPPQIAVPIAEAVAVATAAAA